MEHRSALGPGQAGRDGDDLAAEAGAAGDGVRVCDFTGPVGLSQPTVSHHLKILVGAGVLAREQRSKWAYYRLVSDAPDTLGRLISTPAPTG